MRIKTRKLVEDAVRKVAKEIITKEEYNEQELRSVEYRIVKFF